MTVLDLTLWQLALIAVCALGTQVIGGLAGYGGGLILPLVLVPILGPEAVVPVIGLSGLMTNCTRAVVFRDSIDWPRAILIAVSALPTVAVGAWCYTQLSSRGAALVIAVVLLAVLPLRRWLEHARWTLGPRGGAIGGAIYGFISGGASGTGIILLAVLMAMGLSGKKVIATDAVAAIALGITKTGIFASAGLLPPKHLLVAFVIGVMSVPATYLARWLADRFSARLHNLVIEAAIAVGAVLLLWRALA